MRPSAMLLLVISGESFAVPPPRLTRSKLTTKRGGEATVKEPTLKEL